MTTCPKMYYKKIMYKNISFLMQKPLYLKSILAQNIQDNWCYQVATKGLFRFRVLSVWYCPSIAVLFSRVHKYFFKYQQHIEIIWHSYNYSNDSPRRMFAHTDFYHENWLVIHRPACNNISSWKCSKIYLQQTCHWMVEQEKMFDGSQITPSE